MQQAVDRAARPSGGEPKVRIGASVGETNRDGNDIFGIAVVEAARLCAAALPGQILVRSDPKSDPWPRIQIWSGW